MMPLAITNLRGKHTDTHVADKIIFLETRRTSLQLVHLVYHQTVYVLVTYNLCYYNQIVVEINTLAMLTSIHICVVL